MASRGISIHYWLETYPIMLEALADQSPGMTPYAVAEVLDDMEWEIGSEATEQGEFLDVSDLTIAQMYLAIL